MPGTDTFDALGALDAWVTKSHAPELITASHQESGASVRTTRPLCSLSRRRKGGMGATIRMRATSYSCVVAAPE